MNTPEENRQIAAALAARRAAEKGSSAGAAVATSEDRGWAREFVTKALAKMRASAPRADGAAETETPGKARPWREVLKAAGIPCREAKQK